PAAGSLAAERHALRAPRVGVALPPTYHRTAMDRPPRAQCSRAEPIVTGLATLLGTIRGILCSDRWSVYDCWPVLQRQVCWAHLKRDFQKCVDRGDPAAAVGREGLQIVARLF